MECQHRVGDPGPFVIAGNEKHRHSGVGYSLDRQEDSLYQIRRYAAAKEQVSTMQHEIDPLAQCSLQSQFEIGEKVVTPSAAVDPGSLGKIESEMSVCQE